MISRIILDRSKAFSSELDLETHLSQLSTINIRVRRDYFNGHQFNRPETAKRWVRRNSR